LLVLAVVTLGGAAAWYLTFGKRLGTPTVQTAEVVTTSVEAASTKLTAIGYVQPKKRALVAAKSASRVTKINVSEGQQVKQGDVIAVLEADDHRASVAEAQAALATAKARVRGVKASLADARTALNRESTLFRSGSTGKAVVDAAQSRLNVSAAAVAEANAEVLSAEARLQRAKVGLASTEVLAPMPGKVLKKLVSEGEMVGGGGSPIIELVDLSSMYVEADISERKIATIAIDQPALVALDAFPGKRFRAVVDEIRSTVDRQKGTVAVRVRLVDESTAILPQMTAKVSFLDHPLAPEDLTRPGTSMVPLAAVAARDGEKVLFVLEGNKTKLTKVVIGTAASNDQVELKDGPAAGSKVVLNPPESLVDGSVVKEQR
jgi:RND family efflux transporter MFP subunit